MHWDRKRNKWSSASQQRRDERKEAKMALFRKKPKEPTVSAFDQIPMEVQGKLIEETISIVRTIRGWTTAVPKDLHDGIGKEVMTALRKGGLKMAGIVMSDDDVAANDFLELLKGAQLPEFVRHIVTAVIMAWNTPKPAQVGDAIMCLHANECPIMCPCADGCYCKGKTCPKGDDDGTPT